MSKLYTLSLAQCAVTRIAITAGLVGLACRPDASVPSKGCESDASCESGQRCVDAVCRAEGATPLAAIEPRTTTTRGHGPTEPPHLVWEVELGAIATATPAIAERDGEAVAFVGTHAGRFVGVTVDGSNAGRVVVETFVDGIIWSDPLLPGDGRAYFGADDDRVHAVSLTEGATVWATRIGECTPPRAPGPVGLRCDVDGGPTLGPDGDLYVGADGLTRLRRDGTIVWRYPPDDAESRFHVSSDPVVTDELVVFGAQDGQVHAVAHDGTPRWTVPIGPDIDSTAAVLHDGTIVIGADDGRVYALDPADGALRWAFATGKDIRGGIARSADDGLFVASLDGSLYALSPSGAVRFIVRTQGPIASTPVLDAGDTVYFGSRDDRLYAVTTDGTVRWNVELPDDIDAAVAISPRGTVVVACDDGILRGLR